MTIEQGGYLLTGSIEVNQQKEKTHEVAIWFDYISEETSSVEADITDNWVESNYTLQDHIAIKPRMYRLKGCVGEVIYEDASRILKQLGSINTSKHPVLQKTMNLLNSSNPQTKTTGNVLGGLSSLSGIVGNYTKAAINLAKQIDSSYDRYYQIWQNFRKRNQFTGKRQEAVYAMLTNMLQTRKPVKLKGLMFSLDSQFFDFSDNMYDKTYYIQSVSAHQGDSSYITDIEVTIKEFRIAQTLTTKVDKTKFGGIVADQKTTESFNGSAKGNTVTTTPEQMKKIAGSTITEAAPRNPIKKFFWQIKQNTQNYNDSINNTYTYSVNYKK